MEITKGRLFASTPLSAPAFTRRPAGQVCAGGFEGRIFLLEEKPTALNGRERCMSVRPERELKVMMIPGAVLCRDSAAATFPSCFSAAAV